MKRNENSYKKSGVNISLANKLVKHIATETKKMSKKRNLILLIMKLVVLDHYLISVIIKLKIQ